MAFTKYTQAETVEVETPEEHQRISSELRRTGKTSVGDLDAVERRSVLDKKSE